MPSIGRSLEVNWLRRFDRSLVVPEVVYTPTPTSDGSEVGGYYVHPGKYEWMIDGKYYDGAFGILVVGTMYGDDAVSTLAHEWRHHWQLHNGMTFDHMPWTNAMSNTW